MFGEHENIVLVSEILHSIANKKGRKLKVLDMGCGNGALSTRLDKEKFDYFGTDISAEAIKTAKGVSPWAEFQQFNMDDPVKDFGSFDLIIFCEVLVYVDYETVVERYSQLLNPNGLFVISLYDVWRTKLIWRNLKKKLVFKNKTFVKNMIRNVGWTIAVAGIKKLRASRGI